MTAVRGAYFQYLIGAIQSGTTIAELHEKDPFQYLIGAIQSAMSWVGEGGAITFNTS